MGFDCIIPDHCLSINLDTKNKEYVCPFLKIIGIDPLWVIIFHEWTDI